MIRALILAALLAPPLAGCGGGGDSPIKDAVAQPLPSTEMTFSATGLAIQRPATPDDGYQGGLSVTRDTTGQAGGTPGMVATASLVHVVVGKLVRGFEWAQLALLDNYADAGENAAAYFQANKHGRGPTWGAVAEVADTVGAPGGAVGFEVDNWTTGADTGNRIGVDVVVGDARTIRGLAGGGTAQATAGLRIAGTQATPWAKWRNAIIVTDYLDAGIVLQGTATRGLWLQGSHAVGIDLSGGTLQTAIRLKQGQRITFDEHDTTGISRQGDSIVIDNNGRALFSLDANTGDLHVAGRLTQGAQ